MKAAEVRIGQLFEDRKGNVMKAVSRNYKGVLRAIVITGPSAGYKDSFGNSQAYSIPRSSIVKEVNNRG